MKSAKGHGDEKEMVRARTSFLNTGSYSFLKEELCRMIKDIQPEILIDLGCGEGYYTASFPSPVKFGFDLSKEAIRYAAKHDSSTLYIVASTSRLPLKEHSADCAVVCFAPVFPSSIKTVLKPDGRLITVTPGVKHLWELKQLLYQTPYENPAESRSYEGFEPVLEKTVRSQFTVDSAHLLDLFKMTPYFHKTHPAAMDQIRNTGGLSVLAEFSIHIYRPV